MNQNIVVSNIRIPENEWRQIKIMAAELGMSVNQFLREIINQTILKKQFISLNKKKLAPIWRVYQLAKKKGKAKKLSLEDQIVYEENQ